MNIGSVMVPAAAVHRGTRLNDVAALLAEHCLPCVPVVDAERRVVGVVFERDVRGHAGSVRTAAEAMTQPAATVTLETDLAAARSWMAARGVDLLPVVDRPAGRLVGIVTRAGLARALGRSDEEIAGEIRDEVVPGAFLWCSPGYVRVGVDGGRVTFTGVIDREETEAMLVTAAERVAGVVSVRSVLAVRERSRAAPAARRSRR